MARPAPSRARLPSDRLQRISERLPSPAAYGALFQAALEKADGAEMLRLAQRFAEHYPRDARAHNLLGIAYATAGEQTKAGDAFRTASTLDPKNPDPYVNLGKLAMAVGDKERALVEFDRATSIAPRTASAWRGLGEASAAAGYTAQAVDAFQRAIQLEPNNSVTYAALGVHLAESSRGPEARPVLLKAIALGTRSAKAYAGLAMAMADQPEGQQDLLAALEHAKKAEELGDHTTFLAYARGLALQRLGRHREAAEQFKLVIAEDPSSNGAWIGLSQCYRALGDIKQADLTAERGERILTERQRLGHLKRQIDSNPYRLDLREEYAAILSSQGNYLLAADQLRYVAQHSPNKPEKWLRVAAAFAKAGKPELARYLRGYVRDSGAKPSGRPALPSGSR